ncbi:MAG: hypothetical protein WC473_03195 [Patescibacteria group bacterium]
MHKKELIGRLEQFVVTFEQRRPAWKGQRSFANFLIYYLGKLNIPNDEKYDFWDIDHYLPELMVDAFEQLRTGTDEETARFRSEYEKDAEHEVPNITDLGVTDTLHQCFAVQTTLGFLLKDVMENDWIEHHIETYCNAQLHVLQQTFDKFTRLVYRRGLGEIIEKCPKSGMSGKFGDVELRTFITAGRIMFTFAKPIDKSKKSYYKDGDKTYCNEWSVSFIGEDGDPLLLSAGMQSIGADFRTALNLIEEVIKNWPSAPKQQKRIYKASPNVSLV